MVQNTRNMVKYLIAFLTLVQLSYAWVLTSNEGDITLLGPVLVEPSYGQPASVTLRRNSTTTWSLGNSHELDRDGKRNTFHLSNGKDQKIMEVSQQGVFRFEGPEIRLLGQNPRSVVQVTDALQPGSIEFRAGTTNEAVLKWKLEAEGSDDGNQLSFRNNENRRKMTLAQNGDFNFTGGALANFWRGAENF